MSTYFKYELKQDPNSKLYKIIQHKFDKNSNKIIKSVTYRHKGRKYNKLSKEDAEEYFYFLERGVNPLN